jgi:hypothetical protein
MKPFTGFSGMKTLLWVTLPALFLFHAIVVGVTLWKSGAADAFKLYFLPSMTAAHGKLVPYLYIRSVPCLFLLAVLGCFMMLANGISSGIFQQHDGCTDPLVRVSIASVQLYGAYQWIWSLSSCVATVIIALLIERFRSDKLVQHATSVHDCLMTLITRLQPPHAQALKQWSHQALRPEHSLAVHVRRLL